jgi:hypothetical protein
MATQYDPVARRKRYLEERDLKGRKKVVKKPPRYDSYGNEHPSYSKKPGRGAAAKPPKAPSKTNPAAAKARVARLQGKVSTLEGALTKALTELAQKRRDSAAAEKKDSDGKTTAAERKDSKEYREKNQSKIAEKEKAEAKKTSSSSSSGGSSSSGASRDAATLSISELEDRVSSIRATLAKAKTALTAAKSAAGLSHSDSTAVFIKHIAPITGKESVLMTNADFGGWATRHDVQCADGRTILPGAFADQDGMTVPLVYQHGHSSNEDVLGHAKLEYVPPTEGNAGGMYAHAFFNKTPKGQMAKEQVEHGDLKFLSIFANQLQEKARAGIQHGKDVVKGNIREVSLVLAGANPEAFIDHVSFAHGEDGEFETAAVISMALEVDVNHDMVHAASEDEETLEDILNTLDEKQTTAVNFLLSQALTHSDLEQSSSDAEDNEPEGGDVDASGADVVEHSEGAATDADNEADAVGDDDTNTDGGTDTDTDAGAEASHDNLQEDNSMTHNIFDQSGAAGTRPSASLTHGNTSMEDALRVIVKDAKRNGSLKEALENYIEHTGIMVGGTLQHGVENLDYLFPDAQTIENSPAWISRRMEWVDKVLNGVRKSPFSRIKTITADITPDEARARGYIKGSFKNEEFFALSKRETTPQTIYKKQKLDRDDVIDITTLDVVAWLKAEMKVMLDEELAGAILVGDGRSIGDPDKILENHIRPIASDAELYVTTVRVNTDDADSTVEELVDAVIQNRRYYKGSGTPTFFTTESTISAFLTVKDNFGRRLYSNLSEVAAVLRVAEVVPVEVMERVPDLVGIMVNLSDYTLGADRGGQATMFDDFDIDYNKLIYLIETRCSGALTQPKAAIVFRKVDAAATLATPTEPSFDGTTVTVPTVDGVEYRNADTNAVLTTASPVTLADGQTLNVVAVPTAGRYFSNSENDQWSYTNPA